MGSIPRLMIDWRAVTTWAAITIASTPSSAGAPCGALALDRDLERVGVGEHRFRSDEHLSHVLEPGVKTEDSSDRRVFEDAFLDHERGAAFLAGLRDLGCGLKKEFDVSLELGPELVQDDGRPEDDRHMKVMAGGVHNPRRERFDRDIGHLLDRHGVHLGADGDRRPGLSPAQERDDAGLGDACFDVQSEGDEPRADDFTRVLLAVGQLGVPMDEVPDFDHVAAYFFDFAVDIGRGFFIHGG